VKPQTKIATSQNVASSIPDEVIRIFNLLNPFGLTMGPGVDSASNRSRKMLLLLRAENLTKFVCRISRNCGTLNCLEPKGPAQAYNGIAVQRRISRRAYIW
jgi:hypothetical protein